VLTDTSAPYQFSYTVPSGILSVSLSATAVDLAGNIGTSTPVILSVVPDPLTTVVGRVVDSAGLPVSGAAATTLGSFLGTTSADGRFAIANVPTVRGPIGVEVVVTVAGRRLTGKSAAITPVAAGQSDVGDIVVRSTSIVGYYDMELNRGSSTQVAPIVTAGLQAVDVGDLRTADLSQFDMLFVQNPDNSGFSSIFQGALPRIHEFIQHGGVLILHDRAVFNAASVLPGVPGTIVRDFADPANINIVDATTLATNGPGGVITDSSLDGGNSSSHGWILASSIPPGANGILSQGNPAHLVLYSYPYGTGKVVYSTIPLDFYLAGGGSSTVSQNMKKYAANILAYASSIR
jgi:hypothetical protein